MGEKEANGAVGESEGPDWDAFDPGRYLAANYEQLLAPDRWLFARLIADLGAAPGARRHADVGTGPNLYPLFAALQRAETIEALEWGARDRAYLMRQLTGIDYVWDPWVEFAGERGVVVDRERFRRVVRVGATSVFELPEGAYDSVSSFFCAENITTDLGEFEWACGRLIDRFTDRIQGRTDR